MLFIRKNRIFLSFSVTTQRSCISQRNFLLIYAIFFEIITNPQIEVVNIKALGLETLKLRYEKQSASCLELAL